MPCSWCGVEVGADEGFRASEPEGERKAAFCRLEHVVPVGHPGRPLGSGDDPAARRARRRPGPLRALRRPAGRPPRPARPPPRRAPHRRRVLRRRPPAAVGQGRGALAGAELALASVVVRAALVALRGVYGRTEGRGRSAVVAGAAPPCVPRGVLAAREEGVRPTSRYARSQVAHPLATELADAPTAADSLPSVRPCAAQRRERLRRESRYARTVARPASAISAVTAPAATTAPNPGPPAPRLRDGAGHRAAAGGAEPDGGDRPREGLRDRARGRDVAHELVGGGHVGRQAQPGDQRPAAPWPAIDGAAAAAASTAGRARPGAPSAGPAPRCARARRRPGRRRRCPPPRRPCSAPAAAREP